MHHKHLKKEILYLFIFLIGISFIYSFNFTSTRYIGQIVSDSEIVAIPILNLSNNGLSYAIDNMLPGETREYTFSVSNIEDAQINEILLSYNFEVLIDSPIPLTVKLYNANDEELPIINNQTSAESLTYGTETLKNYKVEIIWDAQDNDYTYANQKAVFHVNLKAIQVI